MKRKGTYVLEMTLGSDLEIEVGALGPHFFPAGRYCYVGSAMGGLDQRLSRHVSKVKKPRWHIDRLTMASDSVEAWESYLEFVPECELARLAEQAGMTPFLKGFGCSDCHCFTHLFSVTEGSMERLIDIAGLVPWRMSGSSDRQCF